MNVPLTVGVAYKHFKDKAKKEVKEGIQERMVRKGDSFVNFRDER